MRCRQRLTSHGAARPRGQQAPGGSAPERLMSLQKRPRLLLLLLLLPLLLMLLLLLRLGLVVFKTCNPRRDRVIARQQLLQPRHHCRIGWCCGKARADARGSAMADASIRCSGASQASSFPSPPTSRGAASPPTTSSGACSPPSWREGWSTMPRK